MRDTFHISTSFGGSSFFYSEKAARKNFTSLQKHFRGVLRAGSLVTVTLDKRSGESKMRRETAVVLDTATIEGTR